MRRTDMIQRALDAPITLVDCTYLQNVLMMSEKFSWSVKKSQRHQIYNAFRAPKMTLGIQKSTFKKSKSDFFDKKL